MFDYLKEIIKKISFFITSMFGEKDIDNNISYREDRNELLITIMKIELAYGKINPIALEDKLSQLSSLSSNSIVRLYIRYVYSIITMDKTISEEIISDSKKLLELLRNIIHMSQDEHHVFNKTYSDRLIELEYKSIDDLIKKYPIGDIDISKRYEELKDKHVYIDTRVASINYLKYNIYLIKEEKVRIADSADVLKGYYYLPEVDILVNLVNRYVNYLSLIKFSDGDPALFAVNMTANEIYGVLTNIQYIEPMDRQVILKCVGEAISLIESAVHKGELCNEFHKKMH